MHHKTPHCVSIKAIESFFEIYEVDIEPIEVFHSIVCLMIIRRVAIWSVQEQPFLKPAC